MKKDLLLVASLAHDLFLKLDTYFLEPRTRVRVTVLNGTFAKSEGFVAPDRVADISVVAPGGRRRPGAADRIARACSVFHSVPPAPTCSASRPRRGRSSSEPRISTPTSRRTGSPTYWKHGGVTTSWAKVRGNGIPSTSRRSSRSGGIGAMAST